MELRRVVAVGAAAAFALAMSGCGATESAGSESEQIPVPEVAPAANATIEPPGPSPAVQFGLLHAPPELGSGPVVRLELLAGMLSPDEQMNKGSAVVHVVRGDGTNDAYDMKFDPNVGWVADVDTKSADFDYSFEVAMGSEVAVLPADDVLFAFTYVPEPMSVNVGDTSALLAARPTSSLAFAWGTGDGSLGRSPDRLPDQEGEDFGPGGLAQLAKGATAILDNWNARLVMVADGTVTAVPLDGYEPYPASGFAIDDLGHIAVSTSTLLQLFAQANGYAELVGEVSVLGMRSLDLPLERLEIVGSSVVSTEFDGTRRALATVDGKLMDGLPLVESTGAGVDELVASIGAGGLRLALRNGASVEVAVGQEVTALHVATQLDDGSAFVVASTVDGSLLLLRVALSGEASVARTDDSVIGNPGGATGNSVAEPTQLAWHADSATVAVLQCAFDEGCALTTYDAFDFD